MRMDDFTHTHHIIIIRWSPHLFRLAGHQVIAHTFSHVCLNAKVRVRRVYLRIE